MRLSLFDSFADMIESIPVGAIPRTLEREQRMLEEDLALQRPVPVRQARSILSFCHFVEALRAGRPEHVFTSPVPPGHLAFYRQTLGRLMTAGELPLHARSEFDSLAAVEEPAAPQLTA